MNTALETGDAARLINLGIARARLGERDEVRALFEAAAASETYVELLTAEGDRVNSRRLARRALAMLNRAEFAGPSRMTMR